MLVPGPLGIRLCRCARKDRAAGRNLVHETLEQRQLMSATATADGGDDRVALAAAISKPVASQQPTLTTATLSAVASAAAAVSPPPTGIYCSGRQTTATSNSVQPGLENLPYVQGALVRVSWANLEPSPGQYNWELIDRQLARAEARGLKVTLAVLDGPWSPAWLATQPGIQMFKYTYKGSPAQMPVPWNQTYLDRWTRLIQAVGQRYGNSSTISLVHMTNSTTNGLEMQLPSTSADVAQWQSLGYTTQKMVDSWKKVLDAYRMAFPSTPLDVEVHPVLSQDTVAKAVVSYGYSTMGNRFGVFAAWWSQHNTSVYPSMFQLIRQAAATSFATVQLVTNATNDPNGFGTGGIQRAIDLARQTGVHYVEVWDTDLFNSQLSSMLTYEDNLLLNSTTATAAGRVNSTTITATGASATSESASGVAGKLLPSETSKPRGQEAAGRGVRFSEVSSALDTLMSGWSKAHAKPCMASSQGPLLDTLAMPLNKRLHDRMVDSLFALD